MAERPRFFDDIAGLAGGALSALTGVKDEVEALVRARVDETIRRLDLVRRDELEAAMALASAARTAQELADEKIAALQLRLDSLESQQIKVNGPGMVG
jgi:BMFP domain-containing protein YqiC